MSNNTDPHSLKYLDFGAGSGYFVAALDKMGLRNIEGREVSKTQVELGNSMIGRDLVKIHRLENTKELLRETDSQVISMIGVLEHLQNPREAIREIEDNSRIKYFFVSVPTFSLSTYLELLSPDIFHRQLGSSHTHLYTEKSLHHLASEFGFKIVGEWWFGSDMVDLYRHLRVNLDKIPTSKKFKDICMKELIPLIDSMQLEIDKSHGSSEVHLLFEKK
jgi:hypothetical protein